MSDVAAYPFRDLEWLPVDLQVEREPDGTLFLESRVPMAETEAHLPAYLRRFADQRPNSVFLGQRSATDGTWQKVTYGQARDQVDALTQALLDLKLPKGRPLAILSGNSIEHALITFAAMQAGIPVAPLSPNYALLSQDFAKLRGIVDALEPAIYFVQAGPAFQKAIEALVPAETPVIWVEQPPEHGKRVAFSDMLATTPTDDVAQSLAQIDPSATAKFMFTSGSTGAPKGVMQSHAGIVATAVSTVQTFCITPEGPSVRLDWTPWNHVFGFVNLCLALLSGGEFYIDNGKPVEPLIKETVRNLQDISPTYYANVPAGYAAILPYLEGDAELAAKFFRQLELFGYAGARLPDDIGIRLQKLAVKTVGHRIAVMTGFGSTETGPTGAFVYWPTDMVGLIGLPSPGVRLKLLPIGDGRYELRMKTVGIMSGYHGRPDLTAAAFDEDGYYRIGDAATFVDDARPEAGLRFAGRIAEDFKLQSGTFVQATNLRSDLLLAAAPMLQDLVVCGENEAFVTIMAWPNLGAARSLSGNKDLSLSEAAGHQGVIESVRAALLAHNAENPGSSMAVKRFLLLDTPPSLDGGEVTDKGSVNAKNVQRLRSADVARLYATERPAGVIEV